MGKKIGRPRVEEKVIIKSYSISRKLFDEVKGIVDERGDNISKIIKEAFIIYLVDNN